MDVANEPFTKIYVVLKALLKKKLDDTKYAQVNP